MFCRNCSVKRSRIGKEIPLDEKSRTANRFPVFAPPPCQSIFSAADAFTINKNQNAMNKPQLVGTINILLI